MKATEGKLGRVFVIRLEDGDEIPQCIESFAKQHGISAGHVILIGGVAGGQIVSGPRYSDHMPPEPILLPVDGVHEVMGIGFLAPEKDGNPVLHVHGALGRAGQTMMGCFSPGLARGRRARPARGRRSRLDNSDDRRPARGRRRISAPESFLRQVQKCYLGRF